MSKQIDPKDNSNFIEDPEELARKLFGYDDETLLRELKEAELELEQMKAEDPELEAQLQAETEAGFQALMQKIHDENIKPVSEREYYERIKEEGHKASRLRPVLKGMFVAAAIFVVLSGMGVVVSARKEFEYQYVHTGKVKNEVIWQNDTYVRNIGNLEMAYTRISDELGIDVMVLSYLPKELKFKEVFIDSDKGHARIVFRYNNNTIYLKQTKYPVKRVVENIVSDRKSIETVYNTLLNHNFVVEQNEVEQNMIEYSTNYEKDGTYYYVEGILDKNEFIKVVEGLTFLQD